MLALTRPAAEKLDSEGLGCPGFGFGLGCCAIFGCAIFGCGIFGCGPGLGCCPGFGCAIFGCGIFVGSGFGCGPGLAVWAAGGSSTHPR